MRTGIDWFDNLNDKVRHFIVGFAIVAVLLPVNKELSAIVLFSMAIGKEVYDRYKGKTGFDVFDLMATVLGGYTVYFGTALIGGLF